MAGRASSDSDSMWSDSSMARNRCGRCSREGICDGGGRRYGSCSCVCHGPPRYSSSSGASRTAHSAQQEYEVTLARRVVSYCTEAPRPPRASASAAAVSITRDGFDGRRSVGAYEAMELPVGASMEPHPGPFLAPAGSSEALGFDSCSMPDMPALHHHPHGSRKAFNQAFSTAEVSGWVDLTQEATLVQSGSDHARRRNVAGDAREGTAAHPGHADMVINPCSPPNARRVKRRGAIDLTGLDGHLMSSPQRGAQPGLSRFIRDARSSPVAGPFVYDRLDVGDEDRHMTRADNAQGAGSRVASTCAQALVHEVTYVSSNTSSSTPSEALPRHRDLWSSIRRNSPTMKRTRPGSNARVSRVDVCTVVDGPARAIDKADWSGMGSCGAPSIDLTGGVRSFDATRPFPDDESANTAPGGDAQVLEGPEPRYPIQWQHERRDSFSGDTDKPLPDWAEGDDVQLGSQGAPCPPYPVDVAGCPPEVREEQAESQSEWMELQRRTGERRDMLDILKRMRDPNSRPRESEAMVAALMAGFQASLARMEYGEDITELMYTVVAIFGDCWGSRRYDEAAVFTSQFQSQECDLKELLPAIATLSRCMGAMAVPTEAIHWPDQDVAEALVTVSREVLKHLEPRHCRPVMGSSSLGVADTMMVTAFLQAFDVQLRAQRLVPGTMFTTSSRSPAPTPLYTHPQLCDFLVIVREGVAEKLRAESFDYLLLAEMRLLASLIPRVYSEAKERGNGSRLLEPMVPKLQYLMRKLLMARINDVVDALARDGIEPTRFPSGGEEEEGKGGASNEGLTSRARKRARRSRQENRLSLDDDTQGADQETLPDHSPLQLEFQLLACNLIQSLLHARIAPGRATWTRPAAFFLEAVVLLGKIDATAADFYCETELWRAVSFLLPVVRLIFIVHGLRETRDMIEGMLGGTEDEVLIAVLDHLERAAMYTNRRRYMGGLAADRRAPRLREPRRFLNPVERRVLDGMRRRNRANKMRAEGANLPLSSLAGPLNFFLEAAKYGPVRLSAVDANGVSEGAVVRLIRRARDSNRASMRQRALIFGTSFSAPVVRLMDECSDCVMVHQVTGMLLRQGVQVAIIILMGVLIDLGRSGDLPHLLLSTLEVFGGSAAVETFFDSAARVLRSVQRIYNFEDELRLYNLDSSGDVDSEPFVSELAQLEEPYEDADNAYFLSRLFRLQDDGGMTNLMVVDIENTKDAHRSMRRSGQKSNMIVITATAVPHLLGYAEMGMGRYAGVVRSSQVNLLSPPIPESADAQLTASIALCLRTFLVPGGAGGRSIEVRTHDRFGRDLQSAIASLTIGADSRVPSLLGRAALRAAVKRNAITRRDAQRVSTALKDLPLYAVRVVTGNQGDF